MLGSTEILLGLVLLVSLVGYCLIDAVRAQRASGSAAGWIAVLAVGLLVLPVGVVASVLYLATRDERRRTA